MSITEGRSTLKRSVFCLDNPDHLIDHRICRVVRVEKIRLKSIYNNLAFQFDQYKTKTGNSPKISSRLIHIDIDVHFVIRLIISAVTTCMPRVNLRSSNHFMFMLSTSVITFRLSIQQTDILSRKEKTDYE